MAPISKQALAQYYTAKGGAIVTSNHFKATPAYMKGEILALNDIVGAVCKAVGVDPLKVLGDAASAAAPAPAAPVAPPPPPPPPPPPVVFSPPTAEAAGDGPLG